MSDWYSEGHGFDHPVGQHSLMAIGHEIYDLSFPTADSSMAVVSYWLTA